MSPKSATADTDLGFTRDRQTMSPKSATADLGGGFPQKMRPTQEAIEVTNRVLRGANGIHVGMHLCRGNRGGHWHAEGSYDLIADKLFNALDIGFFFLEYDSPRAGDFSPLRFVPETKSVVLGLVSTKTEALEERSALERRIEEASRHVDLDRLALSPQCGFASSQEGNPISPAAQEAKLRLVVDVARDVWGHA